MKETHPWLRWYGNVPASLQYPEATIYQCLYGTFTNAPDAVAYDFFDSTATYRQFVEAIDTCARALSELGLKQNDRMLIAMPTCPQAIITFYAVNKLGAVAAFVHPLCTAPEMEQYLNATGATIVLTLDAFYESFAYVTPRLPIETLILARISDYLSPLKTVAFWLARGRKIKSVPRDRRVHWWTNLLTDRHDHAPAVSAKSSDPAVILFSGGTTGTPKGVVLSNGNLISEGMQAAAWARMHGAQSILAIMPIFHGFGLGVCINAALMNGGKSILVPTFSEKLVAEALNKKRPNVIVGVPTLFHALARNDALRNTDLSCLRATFSGADRLPRPIKENFERFVAERGGDIKLLEGYGLTEAVTAIMAMPHEEYREGSIGIPFPDMAAKICSPGTTEEVPPGERGEICVSGPAVMIGYLDDTESTNKVLKKHDDGHTWLHTGDLGTMDEDGFFYFRDRLKRMIKSSGFNVFPSQVEQVLHTHPLIAQACVVGVPDESQIERVKAFVVLKDAKLASPELAEELIKLCRSQLLKWSCPREVEFRKELPQTRLGKTDYKALVQDEIASIEQAPRKRSA